MRWSTQKSYWQQDIKLKEYIWAVIKGITILTSISYLFYHSVLMNFILLPILVIYLKKWKQQCIKQKQREFQLQFRESIQAMAAALSAGYSVENAIKESLKDLQTLYHKDTRIVREYAYMVRQLHMNIPVEKLLEGFAERTKQEDVQNFATIFAMAKRTGGNSVEIIRKAVRTICEKIEVKQEIEIIMSAKKLEFQIMSVIPLGILAYMRVSFPEFMNVLYGNILGITLMTGCLLAYGAAYVLGRKIVEIEV